jgi:hypothetical protein
MEMLAQVEIEDPQRRYVYGIVAAGAAETRNELDEVHAPVWRVHGHQTVAVPRRYHFVMPPRLPECPVHAELRHNVFLAYKEIAAELRIGLDTVRAHARRIYSKLHVSSRTEAVVKCLGGKTLPSPT